MSQPLVFDPILVRNLLENNNYVELATYLDETFKLRPDNNVKPLPYAFCKQVFQSLHSVLTKTLRPLSESINILSKALFRSLRNYAINPDVQKCVITDKEFLDDVKTILINFRYAKLYDVLKVVLQFLTNVVVSNKSAACKIYDLFSPQIFIFLRDTVLVYENSALLYNIALHKSLDHMDIDKYICLLSLFESDSNVEFLLFLLELFLTYKQFWIFYGQFTIFQRLTILETIRYKLVEGKDMKISSEGITTLTVHFIQSASVIFQTANSTDLEPHEISVLLEVISSLCSNENYLKNFQNDKDLLINCGVFLINIHKLGKDLENCFTPIQRLSEIREPPEEISQHPAFGFKGGLVRIIGNLCWKNRVMQDLVREAELIPVILDCCNMDARNPCILPEKKNIKSRLLKMIFFLSVIVIIQWCIFTIRNLCENNKKNQVLIAGLHQQGTVSSKTLEEMGITLQSDGDNSLKIIPLDALKNTK